MGAGSLGQDLPGPALCSASPAPFLPHLPQDVNVLSGCEHQTRRCVHAELEHTAEGYYLWFCFLTWRWIRKCKVFVRGFIWKPPSSAWLLQFGPAAWHEVQGKPHTDWPKGDWAAGKGLTTISRKAALPWGACQCLWCKYSSQARCHHDVTQWSWEELLPVHSRSLPEPLPAAGITGIHLLFS